MEVRHYVKNTMTFVRFRRCRRRFIVKSLLCTTFVYICLAIITRKINPALIVRDSIYLLRPIWADPVDQPKIIIPHFHSDGTIPFSELCPLHGWKQRELNGTGDRIVPKVIDAVIFSIELDILEIRMRELWDVVDIFLVMEGDRTFTGQQKPFVLEENLHRFKFAEKKLRHIMIRDWLQEKPTHAFHNENTMRNRMSNAIESLRPEFGDLIIVGDVDEIPFKETIELLKNCEGYSTEMHLQMRNYVYSFKFYVDTTHWRPHVTTFTNHFRYHHERSVKSEISNYQLADAGWHCSYCFRYLSDFAFKMTSFSHSDRVTAKHLLDRQNIQRKICDGSNIFDMYEEVYTFKELIGTLGKRPRKLSTLGIPRAVMANHRFYKFLLPGGCVREDEPTEL